MVNEYNLRDIFAKQFGYAPMDIQVKDSDLQNKRMEEGQYSPYYGKDSNGREVFMPLTLGTLTLPYTWMSVSSSKTIVETELTDLETGHVFEDIGLSPWKFSVKGLFIGKNGKFPEEDIETLRALYVKREAVKVKSVLTDIHLITKESNTDKVMIMDYNLADNPGVINVRGFSFEMQSTREFSLIIE